MKKKNCITRNAPTSIGVAQALVIQRELKTLVKKVILGMTQPFYCAEVIRIVADHLNQLQISWVRLGNAVGNELQRLERKQVVHQSRWVQTRWISGRKCIYTVIRR